MTLKNLFYPLGICAVLIALVACGPGMPPSGVSVTKPITLTQKSGTVVAGGAVTIAAIDGSDDPGEIDDNTVVKIGMLEISGVNGAIYGAVDFSGNSIVYTADPANAGQTETITYQVVSRFSDTSFVLTSSSTVTISISANPLSGPAPLNAKDDTYEEVGQTQLFVSPFDPTDIDVLRNDQNLSSPMVTIVNPPALGTAEVVGNRVRYSFYSQSFYRGNTDQFTYRVTNANGQTDTAIVKVKADDTARAFMTNNSGHCVTIKANGREVVVQPGALGTFLDFLIAKGSDGNIVATEFLAYDYQLDSPVPGYENLQSVSCTVYVDRYNQIGLIFSTDPEPKLEPQANGGG